MTTFRIAVQVKEERLGDCISDARSLGMGNALAYATLTIRDHMKIAELKEQVDSVFRMNPDAEIDAGKVERVA